MIPLVQARPQSQKEEIYLICRVIGVRNVSFEKDGRSINGKTVYVTYEDRNVNGMAAEKMFLNDRILSDAGWNPSVDDAFRPYYNKFGKVDDIELL